MSNIQTTQPLEELIRNSMIDFTNPEQLFIDIVILHLNSDLRRTQKSVKKVEFIFDKTKQISNDQCPICLENDKCDSILNCKHTFCYDCIKNHSRIKNTCPLCRNSIETITVVSDEK